VNALLVNSAVAPLLAGPSLRTEMVSQLVLGEGAETLESRGDMRRVRTLLDSYEGWVHRGYVHEVDLDTAIAWSEEAAWSEGALLEDDEGLATRAPHRARLLLDGLRVRMPNGTRADVLTGSVRRLEDVVADASLEPPADWAWREFAGTPYLWGGVTAAGIDCSGLVQTTFLARGIALPRDAALQATQGKSVDLNERRAGDLLFFRDSDSENIGHVAVLAGHETIVHSTVNAGRVIRESWADGAPGAALRDRLVAVRRHG
jgi:hypothetical protein